MPKTHTLSLLEELLPSPLLPLVLILVPLKGATLGREAYAICRW